MSHAAISLLWIIFFPDTFRLVLLLAGDVRIVEIGQFINLVIVSLDNLYLLYYERVLKWSWPDKKKKKPQRVEKLKFFKLSSAAFSNFLKDQLILYASHLEVDIEKDHVKKKTGTNLFSPQLQVNIEVLFTNPSARAGYDTRSIFKRSLTGLNSEFYLLLD